jgi:phosphoenolpyruvate synthase/pyruvate phosphate dikinase
MAMMNKLVFGIAEADNLSLAGGKAYALSRMVHAGFNVPEGYVVSANAFMSMTPTLQKLLLNHFDALRADFVAVRSSAINEDGAEAAWAGQLDTFLNCTRYTLLRSIERCWESAHSARAQSYAMQKGLDHAKVAVIIQKMVPGDVSGVAFSVQPVTKDATQVVIEAGFGLGEAIVSGQVTPDTYVVHKKSGEIMQKHISRQSKKLMGGASGETMWETLGAQSQLQKLTDEQIVAVSYLTTELETFFKYPVDVEWAISDGKIYILQSRPITTLLPG